MSDTDHKRPNRREIMAELTQTKHKLDVAEKRAEEAEQKLNHATYTGDKARAERDAAEKRAEEAEGLRVYGLKQRDDTLRCCDRLAKALRDERIETMQAINSEALRWASSEVRTACPRILERVKRRFALTDRTLSTDPSESKGGVR